MTLNEPDTFLKAILADPADALTRLVFADWLEESGTRSNVAWAKYLRLAEQLAHLSPDDPSHAKKSHLLRRLGVLIQAKLRFKAEVFVAGPELLGRLLPPRCMLLDIDTVSVPAAVSDLAPESLAREYSIVPLAASDETLYVAAESLSEEAAETIGFILDRRIEWVPTPVESLQRAIDRAYDGHAGSEFFDGPMTFTIPYQPPNRDDEAQTPAHRVVELFLTDADAEGVRDIVIRRAGPRVEVRFCRAGDYQIWGGFPLSLHATFVSHFRRLARLPIDGADAEQSGIFRYHVGQHLHDVALRIAAGVAGPEVHLTILPYLVEPTAAINRVA